MNFWKDIVRDKNTHNQIVSYLFWCISSYLYKHFCYGHRICLHTFLVGCDPSISACMGSVVPFWPDMSLAWDANGWAVEFGVGGVGGTCLWRTSRQLRTAAVHTKKLNHIIKIFLYHLQRYILCIVTYVLIDTFTCWKVSLFEMPDFPCGEVIINNLWRKMYIDRTLS